MPVGWTLSPGQRLARQMAAPADKSANQLLKIFGGLGAFLALIALMPKFDGARDGDWDRQESDTRKRP